MSEAVTETVWNGASVLRDFLVPIQELIPFVGNPRRGDIAAVRSSIRRFGQVRPVLVFSADGELRIVAGHHVVHAAEEEGWTHVAAMPHEFESEADARAFLLADNRTHDLGRYEDDLLLAQLNAAAGDPLGLDGTGYADEYVADLEARLREQFSPSSEDPPRLDERTPPDPISSGFQVTLWLQEGDRHDFPKWVRLLEHEWGVKGASDVVVRAVREKAQEANG